MDYHRQYICCSSYILRQETCSFIIDGSEGQLREWQITKTEMFDNNMFTLAVVEAL